MPDGNDFLDYLPLFPEETEEAIRQRWNAWANEGLEEGDARYVDTREGSMFQVLTEPMVRESARIYDVMGTEVPASASPLWAWGEYLDDHSEVQDLERLEATPASGGVVFTGEPGTLIAGGVEVGVEPPDPDAEAPEYAVTEGATIPAALVDPEVTAELGTDGTLADGTRTYAVTAVDAFDGETALVETTGEIEAVVAADDDGSVALSWPVVDGATAYRVYLEVGGDYQLLAEVTATEYVDTGEDAPDAGVLIPAENTSGGRLARTAVATEAGVFGNVAAGAVIAVLTPGLPVEVINPEPMVGGTEAEDDEALHFRLMEEYVGEAGGNVVFYLRKAREFPGVGGATVLPLANGPGTILIIIYGADGEPAAQETVDGLQAFLDPIPQQGHGEALVGAHVTVETAAALLIAIAGTLEFEPGYSLDGEGGTTATRPEIMAALAVYIAQVEPGGEVVLAQVEARMVTVLGVHDAADVTLNGDAANVEIPSDPPQVPSLGTVTLTEADV